MSPAPDFELPADVECEKTLLGAVLLDNAAWDEVSLIPKEAWSLDSHLRIRMAMKRLAAAGSTIDIRTLANHLKNRHEVEAVGGVAYLASLTEGLPRRPVIEDYIRIVNDKSMLRRLMGVCAISIARAADQSEEALAIIADLQKGVEDILSGVTQSKNAAVESFFMEAL